MKMKKLNVLVAICVIAFGFMSCSPKVYTTQYSRTSEADLSENIETSQSKGGISIDIAPLDKEEYDKPYHNQKVKIKYKPILSERIESKDLEFPFKVFYKLSPFQVTITNNTSHILRMKDSRVIYIDPDSNEPDFALVLKNDFVKVPYFSQLTDEITKKYPHSNRMFVVEDIRRGYINIFRQFKFVNDFNNEIMPGMKMSGIVLFPVEPENISDGTISFIDMISKTDAAGNPTEKVRFDFKTETLFRYWKVDPNTKDWVEIQETEYDKGQKSPQQYTYDKSTKKWIPKN